MGTGRFVKLFGVDGTDRGVVEQADGADKGGLRRNQSTA